jgi:hypothetical protein
MKCYIRYRSVICHDKHQAVSPPPTVLWDEQIVYLRRCSRRNGIVGLVISRMLLWRALRLVIKISATKLNFLLRQDSTLRSCVGLYIIYFSPHKRREFWIPYYANVQISVCTCHQLLSLLWHRLEEKKTRKGKGREHDEKHVEKQG